MLPFEPFEPNPVIAVAVSGGADSLALTLLADDWARSRGGGVEAVTVDHGLRPAAADEAARVSAWLAARDINHTVLRWTSTAAVTANVQAQARAARYALMAEWCRARDILHLLTAHHRDDQAETLLLRLARGSGLYGLAGMASVEEGACHRLLRPLLAVPPDCLRATLAERGQAWIEDPSNRNPAFARVRVREAVPAFGGIGVDPPRLAATAQHLGRARAACEIETDRVLARAVSLDPGGFARLDPAALAEASEEYRLRALAAVIATVSGAQYPPRFERLERLASAIAAGELTKSRTLAGCELVARRGQILVMREGRAAVPMIVTGPGTYRWDGRFTLFVKAAEMPAGPLSIGPVGADAAWLSRVIARLLGTHHVAQRTRRCLPGLRLDGRLVSVPHLGWCDPGWFDDHWGIEVTVDFRPTRRLTGGNFRASEAPSRTYEN